MAAKTPNALLHGTLDALILKTLTGGPRHGYAIATSIEVASAETVIVEEGSLYPALYRMERRGWLEAEWGESELGRRAKLYRLTRRDARSWRPKPKPGACSRPASRRSCSRNETVAAFVVVARPIDQEVEEELAFHVEMRRREGKPLDAAEIERVRRACLDIARKRDREMRLTEWLGDVSTDIRFAIRQMRGSPGFTFVATLTLALGIGANSAIFALADVTLLRPLPFADAERVVALMERTAAAPQLALSPPTLRDLREQSRSFEALAGISSGAGGGPLVTAPDGTVETVERQVVTTGFFEVLGVSADCGAHVSIG